MLKFIPAETGYIDTAICGVNDFEAHSKISVNGAGAGSIAEPVQLSKIFLCTLCTELCAVEDCQKDLELTRCRLFRGGFFLRV